MPEFLPAYLGKANGEHPENQLIHLLGSNFGMTTAQIQAIYFTIDKNKDLAISDKEWGDFYKEFIKLFKDCGAGTNFTIPAATF